MDDEKQQRRRRWHAVFAGFVDRSRALVQHSDPLTVMALGEAHQYELVARDMIAGLMRSQTIDAVRRELADSCTFWYGEDTTNSPGVQDRLTHLAEVLWWAWQEYTGTLSPPIDDPPGWWKDLR